MGAVIIKSDKFQADPLPVEDLIRDSPSFANGVGSMMHPDNIFKLRLSTTGLIAVMSEFCEHLTVNYIIDDALHGEYVQRCGVVIIFELLRSPEWRNQIVPGFWSMLAYCTRLLGERESFWWYLENANDLLELTKGLTDGEGLRWWYGTLWFNHDKLDATVREGVEKIAKDMSLGDGLSDLNLYLSFIGQEVVRIRQEVDELPNESRPAGFGMDLRAWLIALEGNYDKLAQITGGAGRSLQSVLHILQPSLFLLDNLEEVVDLLEGTLTAIHSITEVPVSLGRVIKANGRYTETI